MGLGDPMEALSQAPEAVEKYRTLELKGDEAYAVLRNAMDAQQELRTGVQQQQAWIKRLKQHSQESGFGLADDAPQVVVEQKKLDRKLADRLRLDASYATHAAVWEANGRLLRSIKEAIVGRPGGCIGKTVTIEVPKYKGSILDAIEGRARRGRELAADLVRARAACHFAASRKAAMMVEVAAWAEQGRPDATSSIEHAEPITWPLARYQFDVYNAGPGAVAFGQLTDIRNFMAWWDKAGMIARLSAEIDAVSDDSAALSDDQRQKVEAQILSDLLAVEREECVLIEIAQAQGFLVEYRADCDPRAILGFEWVTAPPPVPREGEGQAGVVRQVGSR
jgi:hypothetical protein